MASSLPQKTPPGPSKSTRRNGHRTLATSTPVTVPRLALYTRVSTDEQAEHGNLATQSEYLQKRADLDALPVVDLYQDDGVSGTLAVQECPAGAQLLEDARAGRFDTVLVYKVDRFAVPCGSF
jgi:site-specific DNA recombinase